MRRFDYFLAAAVARRGRARELDSPARVLSAGDMGAVQNVLEEHAGEIQGERGVFKILESS